MPSTPPRRMPGPPYAALGVEHGALRHPVGGVVGPAEQPPRQLGAAEEQRRVVLPGRPDAAVDVDHRPRGEVQRAAGGAARGAGSEGELLRPTARAQPA